MESFKKITKYAMVVVVIIIFAACAKRPLPPPGEIRQASSKEAMHGEAVYIQRCNRCHPGGMGGLGPAIINKPLPGFLMRFQIRNGLGTMPSFNKNQLPKKDLDDLIVYIKELKSRR